MVAISDSYCYLDFDSVRFGIGAGFMITEKTLINIFKLLRKMLISYHGNYNERTYDSMLALIDDTLEQLK